MFTTPHFSVNASIHPLHETKAKKKKTVVMHRGTCIPLKSATLRARSHICVLFPPPLPRHTVQRCSGRASAPCLWIAPPAIPLPPPTTTHTKYGNLPRVGAPLQLPRATARVQLMPPHKCPQIRAECVNCTVTSQGHLISTNPVAFPGPKATGYSPGNGSSRRSLDDKR